MPRTKPKPEPLSAVPQSSGMNGPTDAVLTLSEAAAYLRLSEADVLRLVHEQDLPVRQVGAKWRFLKSAIQNWLSQPFAKPKKDFRKASIGVSKDDPPS